MDALYSQYMKKASPTQDAKVKLPQRPKIMHHRERTRSMSEIGGDGEIGKDERRPRIRKGRCASSSQSPPAAADAVPSAEN